MARSLSLGQGERVPYPEPTSASATAIGRANRRTDTKAEVELRRILHARGRRYRKDHLIRAGGLRTHADLAFTAVSLAVFVDGCFWHACPDHFWMPRANVAYWQPKTAANIAWDRQVDAARAANGSSVLRVWEYVAATDAATTVVEALVRLGHGPLGTDSAEGWATRAVTPLRVASSSRS